MVYGSVFFSGWDLTSLLAYGVWNGKCSYRQIHGLILFELNSNQHYYSIKILTLVYSGVYSFGMGVCVIG